MRAPTTKGPIRSPITYYGGKTLLARRIAATFPEHTHYVEPYAGSLAVLLAKPPSAHETVNDLDGDLIYLDTRAAVGPMSVAGSAGACGGLAGDLVRLAEVVEQLTQGRAGVRPRTGWRHYEHPAGSSTSMPAYFRGYVGRIAPAALVWR